jgi:aquaporin related protein
MLEYETANPGQDRAKPEGEHFNPDEHNDKAAVSFAPDEYAMEEGRRMRSNGGAADLNGAGDPVEYGRRQRPFSSSPAPPHINDQYAGLDGGMHSHEHNQGITLTIALALTVNVLLSRLRLIQARRPTLGMALRGMLL